MKKFLSNPELRTWLAIVGASTLVIGAAYAMVQQSTRLSANDVPGIISESTKIQLENGGISASAISAAPKMDLAQTLSPFTIITDSSYSVLASNAKLNGQTPLPPQGVFEYAKAHGNDIVTWQPQPGVRLATTVTPYKVQKDGNTGYIITGQSLKPAEGHIETYGALALAAWVAVIAWVSFVLLLLPLGLSKK